MMQFTKMHGCGNDFIIVDSILEPCEVKPEAARALCHRQFGIGADGLVLLQKSDQADAQWTFFNSDGSIAEMCGNAGRCVARYLFDRHFPEKETVFLKTYLGRVRLRRLPGALLEISFPIRLTPDFSYEEKVVKWNQEAIRLYCLNTGVPHAVIETDNLKTYPIDLVGMHLVKHSAFPQGTNVTFFRALKGNQIQSVTFERGVEKRTLACGTGVAAAAIVYSQLYMTALPIQVHVPGGMLEIAAEGELLLLRGPAEYVFEGEVLPSLSEVRSNFETTTRWENGI